MVDKWIKMHYRYDIIVDTFRTQLKNTNIGFVFGPLFIFMGVFEIIISITTDTYNNSYNSNQDEINNQINYADNRQERFSEQSYEQGFWVGLFVRSVLFCFIFAENSYYIYFTF